MKRLKIIAVVVVTMTVFNASASVGKVDDKFKTLSGQFRNDVKSILGNTARNFGELFSAIYVEGGDKIDVVTEETRDKFDDVMTETKHVAWTLDSEFKKFFKNVKAKLGSSKK